MPRTEACKYCLQPIDTRGMLSHVHFRHADYVRREFSLNPKVWVMLIIWDLGLPWWEREYKLPVYSKSLPAPRPDSQYGLAAPMLPPFQKMPRWI